MTNRCPDSTELLSLALDQLSPRRSDALKVHLATCPHCQQEHATLVQLRSRVKEQVPQMPAELAERTWRALPKSKVLPLWRPFAVGTGIAALVGITVFTLLPGGPTRPTPSFAEVEQAMSEVKTATWTETFWTTPVGRKQEKIAWKTQYWVQLDPPRLSRRSLLENSKSYTVFSGDIRLEALPYMNLWSIGDAWEYERRFTPSVSARKQLMNMILSPRSEPDQNSEVKISPVNSIRRGPWKSFRVSNVAHFERITDHVDPYSTTRLQEEIQASLETRRIQRREVRMKFIPRLERRGRTYSAQPRFVSDEFRYNIAPPPEAFTLPLPEPGVPYVFSDYRKGRKASQQCEQDAQQALIRIARAWSSGNARAFSEGWDWEGQRLIQARIQNRKPQEQRHDSERTKQHWLRAVQKGYPFRHWEVEKVSVEPGTHSVFVRKSATESFPPSPTKSQSLEVSGFAWGTEALGKRTRVQFSATLQRGLHDGVLRLVSLTLPAPPRRRERL